MKNIPIMGLMIQNRKNRYFWHYLGIIGRIVEKLEFTAFRAYSELIMPFA